MMYYFVEYARAVRAVRIALILLGLFMLAVIALRIAAWTQGGSWENNLVTSPTAHVTRTQQADGSTHIVVDDAQRQTHAVIIKRANGAVDMDVTEPRGARAHRGDFVMGNTSLNTSVEGTMEHTTLHYVPQTPKFDMGILFLVTIPMGLIVASILGGPLSKENDGHLELAWTKPASRERYALAAVAVDAIAIWICQLLTIAATLIATLMFFVPQFSYESDLGWRILLALAGPVAWYAFVTAASASLKRGPGVVIGLGWVAALIVPGIAQALQEPAQVNAIAAWFYAIFKVLAYIDPISYLSFSGAAHGNFLASPAASGGILCVLAVGYVLLAVAQWRRVEA